MEKNCLAPHHILAAIMAGHCWYYIFICTIEASHTIDPLVDQAARRTILKYGVGDVIKHIITYPFENIYHFFPGPYWAYWLFQKGIWKKVTENNYIYYLVLSFVLNFVVYWVSPEFIQDIFHVDTAHFSVWFTCMVLNWANIIWMRLGICGLYWLDLAGTCADSNTKIKSQTQLMLMEQYGSWYFWYWDTCYRSFVLEGSAQSAYDICQLPIVVEGIGFNLLIVLKWGL